MSFLTHPHRLTLALRLDHLLLSLELKHGVISGGHHPSILASSHLLLLSFARLHAYLCSCGREIIYGTHQCRISVHAACTKLDGQDI